MQRRLRILADDEIEALYDRPCFTHEERIEYFSLSTAEKAVLDELHAIKSRLYFILQLGYFKARHLFFRFSLREVIEDAQYIRGQHFPQFELTELEISKVTRLKQQRLILQLCNYRSPDAQARQQLMRKAREAAMVYGKAVYVFRELMHYLAQERIVVPGYSFMQDTVGNAITEEQGRLKNLVDKQLTEPEKEALNLLLEKNQGPYEITQLRREPKDFSLGEIQREIECGQQIRSLYLLAKALLPALKISNESIKHYARLVDYYSVFRLKRFDQGIAHLYLLCFVFYRYQRLHDNLLQSLIHKVRGYTDQAKAVAKERVYAHRIEGNENLAKAAQVLKLFTDGNIAESTPWSEVRAKAFAILEGQKLDAVAEHMATKARFDEKTFQWEHLDKVHLQFKRQVRPLLRWIDWASSSTHDPLIEATGFLKTAFEKGKPLSQYPPEAFPLQFVPQATRHHLYDKGRQLLPDRYEFLVYRQLRKGLEAGDIFCRDSVRFRSFEDDLLDDERWGAKEDLISKTGLVILKQPIEEHLGVLEEELEERIAQVNRRIASGENEYIEVKRGKKQWTLQPLRGPEQVNHAFFDQLSQVEIGSVLHFVNQHCPFMQDFEHVLGRYTKSKAEARFITAALVAWGTNLGLGKMAESSDVGYERLSATSDSFIRPETLRAANDRVIGAIAALPLFRHYDIEEVLHSSSDGQKFETRIHTFNARHSPKYFGLKKGIVSYTLVLNHVPIGAEIIGANEHESHYVFDLLFNNTTEVEPAVHSTDTHGTNEINFALLHLFGYQFAPRYKDLYDRVMGGLYGFKHPSHYDEQMLMRPLRKINTRLIIEEWENIVRILLSLALKTTRQSIIIGKLSSHARKNKTKRALWEYDKIIQSLYLLDYVDSLPLRHNVQQALNRGESYHKLRRAISHANFGKLRFRTEYEQQLWGECSRLLSNCIIYYNVRLLSELFTHKESTGDVQGAALLGQVSPVAWQHINLRGRYEFSKRPAVIYLQAIIEELVGAPIKEERAG